MPRKIDPAKKCIFYAKAKCNGCNLCEEIERPDFMKRFEEGKINKPHQVEEEDEAN